MLAKSNFTAGPALIVNDALVADVKLLPEARSVYVPTLLIAQPANVTRPAVAAFGFAVHTMLAPFGVVIARVIEVVPAVWLPPASWIATEGCEAKATLLTEFDGDVTNTSFVAVP